jgi:hypothetical protein
MLVGESTFSKMAAQGVALPATAPPVRVVSLMHLLALKCHAIKHGHPGRIVKDAEDVIPLVLKNSVDVNDPDMRDLFSKHGKTATKKSEKPAGSSSELELPDWSGMDESPNRISIEAAFRLTEEYARFLAGTPHGEAVLRREKCTVEFVLD